MVDCVTCLSQLFRFLPTFLNEVRPNKDIFPQIALLWCIFFQNKVLKSPLQWLLWIFDRKWGIWNCTTSNADRNWQFCGPAFFLNFVNIFLKVSWKINLTVLKLLKSYEEWYATTIFSLNQGLSYNQFNFAWTHFLVIVVIKDIATSITYLKVMATNG